MICDVRVGRLAAEMGALCQVTKQYAWCEDRQDSKIIPVSEYIRALTVAIILAKESPRLDMPVPGADPEGFVWLTYIKGSNGLALEIHSGGRYKWTQSFMGDKRTFESTSLNDVAEAMRTVFS